MMKIFLYILLIFFLISCVQLVFINCDKDDRNTTVNAPPECPILRDCKAWLELGMERSGIYPINPDNDVPFQVYCDMETDGGGWTVFQRRKDGSLDFYRNWNDYEEGFGDLTGEFWLGLSKIHRLTPIGNDHTLRVELQDFLNEKRYAKYSTFNVRDGTTRYQYTLNVGGYSGNAGDSLANHNGMKFTTKDNDNDIYGSNCAVSFKGGWWYYNCYQSNLNGLYLVNSKSDAGIRWSLWKQDSLEFTEMKLRQNN